MRSTLLAAILAASALVPAAALAQDEPRHGGWNGRGHENNGEQPRAEMPRPAPQPQAQPAPQPRFERPTGGGFQRPDRPNGDPGFRGRFDGGQPQAQPGNQPRGDWQRGDRSGERNGWRGGDRFQGNPNPPTQPQPPRDNGFRGDRPDRPGFDNGQRVDPRNDGRRDWHDGDRNHDWRGNRNDGNRDWNRGNGNDHRGWNGNRDWNRGSWNNGRSGWNRDWRHDGRYNWSDYRRYHRDVFRLPRYYAPYGWNYGYRRFSIGFRLNSILFAQNYWISDPYYYQLPPVDGPYRWVRYYNDALLVDVYSGEVVDVVYDIFW